FWLGPEGGQFALWFKPPEPFDMAHWRTPAGFNTACFDVAGRTDASVQLAGRFDVTNYSGTTFTVALVRTIEALSPAEAAGHLGAALPGDVSAVMFQSTNVITNAGDEPWTRDRGLVSIWTLGQFAPLPRGMVIVPFVPGEASELGEGPNGEYFGPMGPDRFSVLTDYALFRCDGKYRSKLGVSRQRARNVVGSYDPDAELLTIVQFNLPDRAAEMPYVNSLWEIQRAPFAGDVVNSYNDGEETPGAGQMGPFYEIESSSPAAELAPGEDLKHVHRTCHFTGPADALGALAKGILGVDLKEIPFPEE
ncbi:hypothetical protein LCGC14_2704840, partial [marine sediment metagenome]